MQHNLHPAFDVVGTNCPSLSRDMMCQIPKLPTSRPLLMWTLLAMVCLLLQYTFKPAIFGLLCAGELAHTAILIKTLQNKQEAHLPNFCFFMWFQAARVTWKEPLK